MIIELKDAGKFLRLFYSDLFGVKFKPCEIYDAG